MMEAEMRVALQMAEDQKLEKEGGEQYGGDLVAGLLQNVPKVRLHRGLCLYMEDVVDLVFCRPGSNKLKATIEHLVLGYPKPPKSANPEKEKARAAAKKQREKQEASRSTPVGEREKSKEERWKEKAQQAMGEEAVIGVDGEEVVPASVPWWKVKSKSNARIPVEVRMNTVVNELVPDITRVYLALLDLDMSYGQECMTKYHNMLSEAALEMKGKQEIVQAPLDWLDVDPDEVLQALFMILNKVDEDVKEALSVKNRSLVRLQP